MRYFVAFIVVCIIIALFLVKARNIKITKYSRLIGLIENNMFDDLMLTHYLRSKVIFLEYRIKKSKNDHPFLKKILQEECDWFKSILNEDNDKTLVFEIKNRLKTMVISEMLNNTLIRI